MPNIGSTELILVLVVILLLFGAKRLPDTARSLGRSMRILKAETKGLRDDDARPGETTVHAEQLPPPPPQYGQPQPAQPQYGQPQYGQPQYGQPQYGQPPQAQPQYGQPSQAQAPYVAPEQGQPAAGSSAPGAAHGDTSGGPAQPPRS